jgi:hypothetical protein
MSATGFNATAFLSGRTDPELTTEGAENPEKAHKESRSKPLLGYAQTRRESVRANRWLDDSLR